MALSNYDLNPIYMINDYVWALLSQELDMQKIKNSIPITNFDGPEFQEANSPYLVYAFSEENSTVLTPHHKFGGTYAVYSPTSKATNDIITLLSMALRREETADNVLSWANNSLNPNKSKFHGINLTHIEVLGSQGAMPPVDEGGLVDGYILFRYGYNSPDHDFSITP